MVMSSANKDNFIPSFPMLFLFLALLHYLDPPVLERSSDSRYLCLDLREKHSDSHINVSCRFFMDALYEVQKVSFCFQFAKNFSFFFLPEMMFRKFPGSPVVRTQCFHCCGLGFNPSWSGNQDSASHVSWPKYKIKINGCLILSNAFFCIY